MTKEEYKKQLLDVIMMVFSAEHEVYRKEPTLKEKLKEQSITPDEYVGLVADEILEHVDWYEVEIERRRQEAETADDWTN